MFSYFSCFLYLFLLTALFISLVKLFFGCLLFISDFLLFKTEYLTNIRNITEFYFYPVFFLLLLFLYWFFFISLFFFRCFYWIYSTFTKF